MMKQNGSCGCKRCNGRNEGERIHVGCGCSSHHNHCGCQNTCRPKPCPHPCRPKPCPPRPCCEKRCEERARDIYRHGIKKAREEYRCCMRNCRRDDDCGCGCEWDRFESTDCNKYCDCYDLDDDNYHDDNQNCWEDEYDDVNDQIYRNQPIAMAYVPGQRWKCPMGREEGFQKGTIFQDLYKPFKGECK